MNAATITRTPTGQTLAAVILEGAPIALVLSREDGAWTPVGGLRLTDHERVGLPPCFTPTQEVIALADAALEAENA